jgi:hypothetical protein
MSKAIGQSTTATQNDVIPCRCGGHACLLRFAHTWRVRCDDCGAQSQKDPSSHNIVAAWRAMQARSVSL